MQRKSQEIKKCWKCYKKKCIIFCSWYICVHYSGLEQWSQHLKRTPRVWSGIPRVWIFSLSVWLLTRNPDLWTGLVYWHTGPETLVIYRINKNKSGTRGQASNGMREILALHWQPSTQRHKSTDGLADERRDRQSEDGRRTTDGGRTDGRRTADGRRMDSRTDKRTNGRQTNGQMDEQTKRQMKKLRVLYHCRIYMMTLYTRF